MVKSVLNNREIYFDEILQKWKYLDTNEDVKPFNVKKATDECVKWVKDWFNKNGKGCNAIVGLSGGKDSTIVAALCVKALGKDRVIGVLMPNGEQSDIDVAKDVASHLGIKSYEINIGKAFQRILFEMKTFNHIDVTEQTKTNLPARLRMSTLYAVSQSNNGRVMNTCNLSEDWVGYATKHGDGAGDCSPLGNFTVTEVKEIGRYLGLPDRFVDKVPQDGLQDKTDEDNLGFTYDVLDNYIRFGVCDDEKVKKKIDTMHEKNKFKLEPMEMFKYEEE